MFVKEHMVQEKPAAAEETFYRIILMLSDGSALCWEGPMGETALTRPELDEVMPMLEAIKKGELKLGYNEESSFFGSAEVWTNILGSPAEELLMVVDAQVEQCEAPPPPPEPPPEQG